VHKEPFSLEIKTTEQKGTTCESGANSGSLGGDFAPTPKKGASHREGGRVAPEEERLFWRSPHPSEVQNGKGKPRKRAFDVKNPKAVPRRKGDR